MPRPPGPTSERRYVCKCFTCKHEWTSHLRAGPPKSCPRPNCQSTNFTARPLNN